MFISSEVAPFSKTGGLGDVSSALPKALKALGHEVRVVTPRYHDVRERRYNLREISRLRELSIALGDNSYPSSVKSGFLSRSKVQAYFIENTEFYDRPGYYTNPETGGNWDDNHLRFAFFCHAAIQLIQNLEWVPDIIHCNDWQSALVPYLIRTDPRYLDTFQLTRTVLHLHNLAFQGLFPAETATELCFTKDQLSPGSALEFYEQLSFLKAGIMSSDGLITVSPTYSEQILESPEFGCGLEDVLTTRMDRLFGVLNGVDTSVWNPETDKHLRFHYGLEDFEAGKSKNKAALQKRLGLPVTDSPLLAVIARLSEQKGLDLLLELEQELLSLPMQLVVLGTGESGYADRLKAWQQQQPLKVSITLGFRDDLAHFIEAGADIFLMPSRFEPCGLNQMYSMLYGTVPVVRRTGGLADTVIDYTESPQTGNGFVFEEYSSQYFLQAIMRALKEFGNKPIWNEIQSRGMMANFGWERAATKVAEVYSICLGTPAFFLEALIQR